MKISPKRRVNALCRSTIELLVAKEDHAVIKQCLTDLADHGVVKVLCDINAANLSSECAGDRRNLNVAVAHPRFLRERTLSVAESWVKSIDEPDQTCEACCSDGVNQGSD